MLFINLVGSSVGEMEDVQRSTNKLEDQKITGLDTSDVIKLIEEEVSDQKEWMSDGLEAEADDGA